MAQQIIGVAARALIKAAMKKKAKSSMTKKAAVAAGATNESRSVKKVPSKQAMEKAILRERMPKGQSELARRAREIESKMQGGPKKINSQQNLSKAQKSSANNKALKAANKKNKRK
jgi:hypothetical protein